ncbi:HIT family protein [Alloscardovia venturai]|uniref:HIT family protein n=2 Tax=Alloscardovia venturai TaxID=1769421 RepID=A0ABW2Y8K9_9BIFI
MFCTIAHHKMPAHIIYEDSSTIAFLDINPYSYGHTLVIPKIHTLNILTATDETLGHVMHTVKLVSNHYINDCGYDGITVLSACNEVANQSIPHLHIHIVPRKNDDSLSALSDVFSQTHSYDLNEGEQILTMRP